MNKKLHFFAFAAIIASAILIPAQNVYADEPTDRVLQLLEDHADNGGTVGLYLKEVNNSVLAAHNEGFIFEPASTIKVAHHLNAMREVQNDPNFSLATPINWFQDSEDGNGVPIVDDPNTSGDERSQGCPVDSNPATDPLDTGLRAMMVPSDNRWTQAFRVLLGQANINDMMQNDLGMANSLIQHRLGCGFDAVPNHNQLTLVDAGKLYEAVANGFLVPPTRDDFYEIMIQDTGRFDTIIDDEVMGLGLSSDGLVQFKAERTDALKAGSYNLSDGKYRTVAGWAKIPFKDSSCNISPREYVFGAFVNAANTIGPGNIRSIGIDLFREEIHAALETWADCETDLSIEKTGPSDPVVAGTQIVYTVTVDNNGPNDATNVIVVDTLHPDLIYVSDTGGCVEGPPNTLTCNLGNIVNGNSDSFDITVDIPSDLVYNGGTVVGNEAEVSSDQFDFNPGNNEDSIVNQVIAEADVEILSFTPSATPGEVLIGDSFGVTLTKTITNNGPSSPVDVDALVQASGDGVGIVPPQVLPGVIELEDGEVDQIIEDFTITCEEPGTHEIEFTNEITPVNAIDTDLNNNEAEVTIEIECIIPVQINIHPGSFPNPINLKSKGGVVPVAILSTDEGVFGLPVAVDATMIDPLSVHFGPADVLFDIEPPGGATEFHNKGHTEDSFEPDDATKDGDTDMVLHFKAKDTELESTDTEACTKGQINIGGMMFTFFGCDVFVSKP